MAYKRCEEYIIKRMKSKESKTAGGSNFTYTYFNLYF